MVKFFLDGNWQLFLLRKIGRSLQKWGQEIVWGNCGYLAESAFIEYWCIVWKFGFEPSFHADWYKRWLLLLLYFIWLLLLKHRTPWILGCPFLWAYKVPIQIFFKKKEMTVKVVSVAASFDDCKARSWVVNLCTIGGRYNDPRRSPSPRYGRSYSRSPVYYSPSSRRRHYSRSAPTSLYQFSLMKSDLFSCNVWWIWKSSFYQYNIFW